MQGNPIPTPASIGAQPFDADLQTIASLTPSAGGFLVGSGSSWTVQTGLNARENLGATTVGGNLFTLANPGAIRFPQFNADNSVSSLSASDFRAAISTPNFESGTWTPVVFGLTTAGTGTYTNQAGTYVRIGNLWILNFRISWTAHTGTGNPTIRGLPLTVPSGVPTRGSAAISAANLTLPANTMLSLRGNQGADELFVAAMPVGGGGNVLFALPSIGNIEGSISLIT
jgi:hypothetical protein